MKGQEVESYFGLEYKKHKIGKIVYLSQNKNLRLSSGYEIQNFPVAYQSYGNLNADKSNAILICHALTGDQYIASPNPVTGKKGWWDHIVGENKTIDTNKFFVISCNVLGGCMGTMGPKEINPENNKPYNLDFPMITIGDMVQVQRQLIIEHFGIKKLFAVIGGSMGGMNVLEWASKYPEMISCAIPVATAARHTTQNIAFHEVGRQAIMADPNWCEGNYLNNATFPKKGLAVARMTAHVTYLSENALTLKFGRNLQGQENASHGFGTNFQVENYLRHQGINFVDRFDANSYLYITKAMDYFDLAEEYDNNLSNAFSNAYNVDFCLFSFSDDWMFPTSETKRILRAINYCGINSSFLEIKSDRGHDSFLLEFEEFSKSLHGFIKGMAKKKKI